MHAVPIDTVKAGHSLHVPSPDAMTRLGAALAKALRPGDFLALNGPLGAGKSHLARAIIRAALGDDRAEVPSPTYTLVNVYETPLGEIWHGDLYRIADQEELAEIGLIDAMDHAIVLLEWAERLSERPTRHLDLSLHPDPAHPDHRTVTATATGADWSRVLDHFKEAP